MGKVLIATFEDEEEIILNELICFLKKKNSVNIMNVFSANTFLEYEGLTIDLEAGWLRWMGKT